MMIKILKVERIPQFYQSFRKKMHSGFEISEKMHKIAWKKLICAIFHRL